MKIWKMFAVIAMVLSGSHAFAETWVPLGTNTSVDKDSIRRGSDGLIYFNASDASDDDGTYSSHAVDCNANVDYLPDVYGDDWRDHGQTAIPDSVAEVELKYACANAP